MTTYWFCVLNSHSSWSTWRMRNVRLLLAKPVLWITKSGAAEQHN